MRRPSCFLALLYAGGLMLAEAYQPPLWALFALSLTMTAIALVWAPARSKLIWPLLILAGWTNLLSRTSPLSPNDLRLSQTNGLELVTLRGSLPDTPSQRIYLRDEKESARSLAELEVTHCLHYGTNWQPALGSVLVLTPGVLPGDFFAGQEVEITGVLGPPPGPEAEGLFNYAAYLRRKSIYFQLKATSTNDWVLLSPKVPRPLSDRFLAWAQATLARGLPAEDPSLQMLWAMTLGWKTSLNNEVYEPFMRSGTMHIFAISGLHIALIAAIFVSLLRVLQIPRVWCGWILVPLIWFYTGATGWQPSAIRSAVMMSIIIGGWALSRPSDLLNSLGAAAFIILVWDPQQLFGASFQLSFFVVLSIALILPPIERMRDRLLQHDPMLPAELVPPWRRLLKTPLRWISTSLGVSLAAWLGSLPLTAYYFHLLSPITLVANLVIVPLSSCALACNLGSLLCGSWLSWATELFNHSAWFWMTAMMRLSEWSTWLPSAYFYVRAPSSWQMAFYYCLLASVLGGFFRTPKRRALALATLSVFAAICLAQWWTGRSCARLWVTNVEGGIAIYTSSPGGKDECLVDCGDTNSVQFITKPFLRAQGVNRLATLVLSHGDVRHTGGAELITDLFAPRQICASSNRFRSPTYRLALAHFCKTPGLVRTLLRGDKLGSWSVLHPGKDERFPRADDNALVLAATFYGTRILLLSDLGRSGQDALLESTPDLRADILVTGLPSLGEAICDPLLDAIQPHLIIVADSEFPAAERASTKLRERLAQRKVPVLYTRFSGAASILIRGQTWKVDTMSGGHFQKPLPRGDAKE
jgi:competence protein ComEC